MSDDDIGGLLKNWDYESGELSVRKIAGSDRRSKIQIRMDLGVMQLEWSGRPDGSRPHDHSSLLDYYRQRQRDHDRESGLFTLSREDCWALGQEAMQFYWRRISFFELREYCRAEEDARHNLSILDLCSSFALHEEDRQMADQYRPFVTAHRIQARALARLEEEDHDGALREIRTGIAEVERLLRDKADPEAVETSSELQFLKNWEQEVDANRPRSESEQLSAELSKAVAAQDFERAADLRDQIDSLQGGLNPSDGSLSPSQSQGDQPPIDR